MTNLVSAAPITVLEEQLSNFNKPENRALIDLSSASKLWTYTLLMCGEKMSLPMACLRSSKSCLRWKRCGGERGGRGGVVGEGRRIWGWGGGGGGVGGGLVLDLDDPMLRLWFVSNRSMFFFSLSSYPSYLSLPVPVRGHFNICVFIYQHVEINRLNVSCLSKDGPKCVQIMGVLTTQYK